MVISCRVRQIVFGYLVSNSLMCRFCFDYFSDFCGISTSQYELLRFQSRVLRFQFFRILYSYTAYTNTVYALLQKNTYLLQSTKPIRKILLQLLLTYSNFLLTSECFRELLDQHQKQFDIISSTFLHKL